MINQVQSCFARVDKAMEYCPVVPIALAQSPALRVCVIAISVFKALSFLTMLIVRDFDHPSDQPLTRHFYSKCFYKSLVSFIPIIGPVIVLFFEKVVKPYLLAAVKDGRLSIMHPACGWFRDRDTVLAEVERDPSVFQSLPSFYKKIDEKIITEYAATGDLTPLNALDSLIASKIFENLVENDSSMMKKANSSWLKREKYVELAQKVVEKAASNIQFIKSKYLIRPLEYRSLLTKAMLQDPNSLDLADDTLLTPNDKIALQFIKEHRDVLKKKSLKNSEEDRDKFLWEELAVKKICQNPAIIEPTLLKGTVRASIIAKVIPRRPKVLWFIKFPSEELLQIMEQEILDNPEWLSNLRPAEPHYLNILRRLYSKNPEFPFEHMSSEQIKSPSLSPVIRDALREIRKDCSLLKEEPLETLKDLESYWAACQNLLSKAVKKNPRLIAGLAQYALYYLPLLRTVIADTPEVFKYVPIECPDYHKVAMELVRQNPKLLPLVSLFHRAYLSDYSGYLLVARQAVWMDPSVHTLVTRHELFMQHPETRVPSWYIPYYDQVIQEYATGKPQRRVAKKTFLMGLTLSNPETAIMRAFVKNRSMFDRNLVPLICEFI